MVISQELCLKIRKSILEGKKYTEIRNELDIAEGTWDYWYWKDLEIPDLGQGFRTFVNQAKHERVMRKVGRNIDDFLDLIDIDEEGKRDSNLARLKADMTKFVAERLGKNDGYSTKVETENETNIKADVNITGMEIL